MNMSILNTITGVSNTLSITIPPQKAPSTSTPEHTPAHKSHNCNADKENQVTKDLCITIKVPPLCITAASSQGPIIPDESENSSDENEEGLQNGTRCVFCPAIEDSETYLASSWQ
jgi:hypothetical protein